MLRDLDLTSNKIHCAVNQDATKEPAVEKTRMEDSGSPSLIEHEESVETFSPPSAVIPGATGGSNGVFFNTKYEGPGTNVIANVTSVGDLREKVTLSWKNINVFVPQPRPSICKRLCCGDNDDEPRIKQILFDGKQKLASLALVAGIICKLFNKCKCIYELKNNFSAHKCTCMAKIFCQV